MIWSKISKQAWWKNYLYIFILSVHDGQVCLQTVTSARHWESLSWVSRSLKSVEKRKSLASVWLKGSIKEHLKINSWIWGPSSSQLSPKSVRAGIIRYIQPVLGQQSKQPSAASPWQFYNYLCVWREFWWERAAGGSA